MRLKIASILLFWFGITAEFLFLTGILIEYQKYGQIKYLTPLLPDYFVLFNLFGFIWTYFVHIIHVIGGYLLAKGTRTGIALSIAVSLWETLGFLILFQETLFSPTGIAIRILFAFIIFLIISGRKELVVLQTANWRPWKNPKSMSN